MNAIDINCDLGEGFPYDAAIMPYISSCNIACGGHFGTKKSIIETILLALKNDVKIGAHPSYPDTTFFGRKSIEMDKKSFITSIREQLVLFFNCAATTAAEVHHIKAHGALYNDLIHDVALINRYLEAIELYKKKVLLYVPYNSMMAKEAATKGFKIAYEAFADRNYTDDLKLVPRSEANAVITKSEKVLEHVLLICKGNRVKTISGKEVSIKADTICVHGDNENALAITKTLFKELQEHNITVE